MANFPTIVDAIGRFEGYGTPGVPATNNNNPGNIIWSDFARSHGAVASSNGFAVFPSSASGYDAADALITSYANKGETIQGLIEHWAPPNAPGNTPQATANYVNYVAKAAGVSPDTKLSDLMDGGNKPPGFNDFSISGLGGSVSSLSWARIATFLLALIVIAAGLFLFKPVQDVVVNAAKDAAVA